MNGNKSESGALNPEANPNANPDPLLSLAKAFDEDRPQPAEPAEPAVENGGESAGGGNPDAEDPAAGAEEGGAGEEGNGDGEDKLKEQSNKNKFEESAYGLQKRIGKLTAQKKAALEEVEALKSQLAELRAKAAKGGGEAREASDPLESLDSQEDIDEYAQSLRSERDAALKLLASGEEEFEVGGRAFTRERVAEYLESVNRALELKVPARRKAVAEKAAAAARRADMEKMARETFDWASDENSAGSQWVRAQLSDPELSSNLPMLLGYAYEGLGVTKIRKNYQDRAAAKKRGQPAPTPPPAGGNAGAPSLRNADGSFNQELAKQLLWKDES